MPEITINIDDLEQVDALFEVIAGRWTNDQLESWLRQHRTPEQIRADNEEATRDRWNELLTHGGPGR